MIAFPLGLRRSILGQELLQPLVSIDQHGAELQAFEQHPVAPDAGLGVKDRAAVLHPDSQTDQRHQGGQEHQGEARQDHIHKAAGAETIAARHPARQARGAIQSGRQVRLDAHDLPQHWKTNF